MNGLHVVKAIKVSQHLKHLKITGQKWFSFFFWKCAELETVNLNLLRKIGELAV